MIKNKNNDTDSFKKFLNFWYFIYSIIIFFVFSHDLVLEYHEMGLVSMLDKLVAENPDVKFGSYP